jgi:hypothetical protein
VDKDRAKEYLNRVACASSSVLGEYGQRHQQETLGYVGAIQYYISLLYKTDFFFEKDERESERWQKIAVEKNYYRVVSQLQSSQIIYDFEFHKEKLPGKPIFKKRV